ncbi:MAG: FhaA domain-containing protein [Anaerolineales bacterium]
MKARLDRIERDLESLIEGSLASLLGARLSAGAVASKLTQAMAEVAKEDQNGRTFAPDQFALTLHPSDATKLLREEPEVQDQLASGLMEAARQGGWLLVGEPHITVAADPTLGRWQIRVVAWHSGSPLEFTHPMDPAVAQEQSDLVQGAFLIVNGEGHFPLSRPVVNIGRRLDNQLILDDPHVSRTHAQLRVRNGRYVVFDLGSTSGTKVNGRRVKQHTLHPGDVISMAEARLVYGEDPAGLPESTAAYTPPFPPRPAGDLRTRRDIRSSEPPEEE